MLVVYGPSPGAANRIKQKLWNGTNWTEVNDLNTGRRDLDGAGSTNTAGLAMVEMVEYCNTVANTESWNGTNWTEV